MYKYLKNIFFIFSMRLTYSKKEKEPVKKKEEIPSFAQSPKGFIIELIKIVLIALAIIIPIRYFLFQPFYVRGASMEPNFYDNEYLIIDEITYRFSDPQRGDVIVISVPQKKSEFLIKRIIGLPDETIEITNNQVIIYSSGYLDGQVLKEDYLGEGIQTPGNKKVELGSNEYYVLGDNRPVSLDSRNFGSLSGDSIVGRAWLRVWPFSQFRHFSSPEYNFQAT